MPTGRRSACTHEIKPKFQSLDLFRALVFTHLFTCTCSRICQVRMKLIEALGKEEEIEAKGGATDSIWPPFATVLYKV